MPQVPGSHVAAGTAIALEALVRLVELGLRWAGQVPGWASTPPWRKRYEHGQAPAKRSSDPVPEQINVGRGRILAGPAVAWDQQAATVPAAESGAA